MNAVGWWLSYLFFRLLSHYSGHRFWFKLFTFFMWHASLFLKCLIWCRFCSLLTSTSCTRTFSCSHLRWYLVYICLIGNRATSYNISSWPTKTTEVSPIQKQTKENPLPFTCTFKKAFYGCYFGCNEIIMMIQRINSYNFLSYF